MNNFEINDNRILKIIEQELSKEDNHGYANRYNPFELLKPIPCLDEIIEWDKKSPKNETEFISDVCGFSF